MAGESGASAAKGTSAAIYERFMSETGTLRSHAAALAASFEQVSGCVRDMLDVNAPPQPSSSSSRQDVHRELSDAVGGLTRQVARATHTLQSCLQDLTTMGEAVDELIANAPHNEASLLLLNLYGALLRQVGAYYQDMSDVFKGGNAAVEKCRGQLVVAQQSGAEKDTQRSGGDGQGMTRQCEADGVGEGAERRAGAAAAASPLAEPTRPTSYTFSQAPVSAVLPVPIPVPADDASHADAPSTTSSARARKKQAMTSHAVAHDGDAATRKKALASRAGTTDATRAPVVAEVTPAADASMPFLQVNGTIEEALGPLVLASRPDAFSPVDQLRSRAASATYYIRLVRPGNLTYFVVKNYLDPDEEVQTDLLCEVLETDCVELGTFESTDGEVTTPRDLTKAQLPMCAWRTCSDEEHGHLLHTMYILLEQPPGTGHTLLVHDAIVTTGRAMEEVLHVVSVVTAAPQFAKVAVYVKGADASGGAGAGQTKAAAIVSFTRGAFIHAGFGEVSEEEVTAWLQRQRAARDDVADGGGGGGAAQPGRRASNALQLRAQQPPIDATAAFQPNVQLASLDEPGEDGGSTLTFGDVAMGAVRGGLEVLKAPLAVGRAVLGVTGVTEAMRSTMEQTFHRSFPQLNSEELIESYGCAWQEGSIPKQGNLFITPRWLCFQGSMSNAQFALEYDEIKDIKKAKMAKVFDNAIEVQTHVSDTYFLTGFLQRDQSYSVIVQQWLKS